MCTKSELQEVLTSVCEQAKMTFGEKLCAVFLYGSYARGDYDTESDVDILILVDVPSHMLRNFDKAFTDYSLALDLKYNIVSSLVLQDKDTFDRYKSTYPFFKNILKEGVDLIA